MASSASIERAAFALSLLALTFVYGVGVGKLEWVPHDTIAQALDEGRSVAISLGWSDPGFVHPQRYDRQGVRIPQPEDVEPGLTLLISQWRDDGEWVPQLRLITAEGNVLHRWTVDREAIFGGSSYGRRIPTRSNLHGSHLFPNGDVLFNVEYIGTVRMDACGDVQWTVTQGNHHSIHPAGDDTFWVPGTSEQPRTGSEAYPDGFPGLGGTAVWIDRILRITGQGEIVEDINLLDVMYANGLDLYFPKTAADPYPTPDDLYTDITHLNDVEPLPAAMADAYPLFDAGDLVVSLRHPSLVFVFDPDTKEVKWHSSDPFAYQHDPDFLGDGWIGVFNNKTGITDRTDGSSMTFVRPHTGTVEERYPTEHSGPFYTATSGKFQRLSGGNLLLTESTAGRAAEVDSTGRTVWEWVHPGHNGTVPALKEAARYPLRPAEVASWPCSPSGSSQPPASNP